MGKEPLNIEALRMLARINGFTRPHCSNCIHMVEEGSDDWCAARGKDPAPETAWSSDQQVCEL